MTTTVKTLTLATVLIAGTMAAYAHPQHEEGEYRNRKRPPHFQQQQRRCPGCGEVSEQRGRRGGDDWNREERKEKIQRKRARREKMHQKALEKYDHDGDGKLSEEELAELKADMKKRRDERKQGKRPDWDVDHNEIGPPE